MFYGEYKYLHVGKDISSYVFLIFTQDLIFSSFAQFLHIKLSWSINFSLFQNNNRAKKQI